MTRIKILKNNDGKLMLKTLYDPEIIKKIKNIKGYWWHKNGKYWTLPFTNEVIIQLNSKFGIDNLDIDQSIKSFFLEVSKKKSSNAKSIFTEVFPVKKNIISELYAYNLKIKNDKSQKIGGKLSYQARNHFEGHWIWTKDRIVTDSPQNIEEIKKLMKELWEKQPETYKDLIDIEKDENWKPSPYDIAIFVAYGLIEDLQSIIKEILKNKAHYINNAQINRICDIRPWVINNNPAISISISSHLIFKDDLKKYSETLRKMEELIGLWVSDKTSTLKGEVIAIAGNLNAHRNRLLRLTSRKTMSDIIEHASDSEYVVSIRSSTKNESYDYVINALNIILRMEDFNRFNIDGKKAQKILRIEPEIRFNLIKEISKLLINKKIIANAYNSKNYPGNFLTSEDINFRPCLEFGNNKSFDYDEKTVLNHLYESGLYKISEKFESDKTINVSILNCLKFVSLDSFCKNLHQTSHKLGFKINYLSLEVVEEISRLNLEDVVENIINEKPDILLTFIPDDTAEDSEDWSVYNHIKSLTLSRDLANQVIYHSTINNKYAMGNIVLGILGKIGNIPFILAEPLHYTDYVVGIDIAHAKKKKLTGTVNATAITRIYLSSGEFLRYTIYDATIEGETIPDNVLKNLFPANEFRGKKVVIHRDGYFRGKEKVTLKLWAEKIGAEFYFVEVIKTGTPRIYLKQKGRIKSPHKGNAFKLNEKQAFLVSSLPAFKSGTPQPLRVIAEAPLTIENAIHSVLSLTLLHYGSLRSPKLPVTIHYSDRIAYLALRGIKPRNLDGNIPFWL